jgi:hypothetical protein
MTRIIALILTIYSGAAFANATPTGPLNTTDVGLDANKVCWQRGPAGVLHLCGATASGITVTATTALSPAGNWLIVPPTGTPTVVTSTGTTPAGVAGTAYLIVAP